MDGHSAAIPAEPFAEALRDNVELLLDLLTAIRCECAQVDARAAELFFAGMATLIEAFSIVELRHLGTAVDPAVRRSFGHTGISMIGS